MYARRRNKRRFFNILLWDHERGALFSFRCDNTRDVSHVHACGANINNCILMHLVCASIRKWEPPINCLIIQRTVNISYYGENRYYSFHDYQFFKTLRKKLIINFFFCAFFFLSSSVATYC